MNEALERERLIEAAVQQMTAANPGLDADQIRAALRKSMTVAMVEIKRGPKPGPDPRTAYTQLSLNNAERSAVDAARGDKPAATWVRELLLKAIGYELP